MKATRLILIATLPICAQDIAPKDSERDPVLNILLEDESAADAPLMLDITQSPLGLPDPFEELPATTGPEDPAAVAPDTDSRGVMVQVEGGSGRAPIDAGEVKLLAPFPAKPISEPQNGWKIIQTDPGDDVKSYVEKVQLANGTTLDLSIRPHVLVPDADGSRIFSLREPGFRPEFGYSQQDTIGAVLADSITELDRNGDRLEAAAQRLSELLDSLPAPPAPPAETDDSPEQEP